MKPELYIIDDNKVKEFVKNKGITDYEINIYKKVIDVLYEYHMIHY